MAEYWIFEHAGRKSRLFSSREALRAFFGGWSSARAELGLPWGAVIRTATSAETEAALRAAVVWAQEWADGWWMQADAEGHGSCLEWDARAADREVEAAEKRLHDFLEEQAAKAA